VIPFNINTLFAGVGGAVSLTAMLKDYVKVIRLEVDSTSEMESEDSKRSDRLKSEA
jgi:hypothetical protein